MCFIDNSISPLVALEEVGITHQELRRSYEDIELHASIIFLHLASQFFPFLLFAEVGQ